MGDADLGVDDGVEVDTLVFEGGVGELHQVVDLARGLDDHADIVVGVHAIGAVGSRGRGVEVKGNTGRVVSSVLQSLESSKQQVQDLLARLGHLVRVVAKDATHTDGLVFDAVGHGGAARLQARS